MTDRVEKMNSMRFDDLMTLQEIADAYNISRERVRQIIGNTGRLRETKIQKIVKNSTKTTKQLADILDVSQSTISKYRSNHHDVEDGTVKQGQLAERYVSNILYEMGISNNLMPINHSFDILALDTVRIDVKCALTPTQTSPGIKSPQWHFCLKADVRGRYRDIFVCVIWDTKDSFIIPFDIVKKNKNNLQDITFCWPTKRPEIAKYQKYHNRWRLIREYANQPHYKE